MASLLQAFYGIRSERLLVEQLHYNLLLRWFVGLSPDDAIWHPTTFTKNRDRLLNNDVMGLFLEKLMGAPEVKRLLSDEHFSVDGTLLQAWASHASLKRINGQEDPPPPPTGPGLADRHKSETPCNTTGLSPLGGQGAVRAWGSYTKPIPRGFPRPAAC